MISVPTLPGLAGDLHAHLCSQPGVDEGLATGGAIEVLRCLCLSHPNRIVELPSGTPVFEDVYVFVVDHNAKHIVSATSELVPNRLQSLLQFHHRNWWDQCRLLIAGGGRISRAFQKTPPSSELRSRLEHFRERPLVVRSTSAARELYKERMLRLASVPVDASDALEMAGRRVQMVAFFIAAGTESQLIDAEILATAWTIAVVNHVRAFRLLERVGLARPTTP